MKYCASCKAMFTGRTRDDKCSVCVERDRRDIYADASSTEEVVRRLHDRENSQELTHAAMHGLPGSSSGLCVICDQPLDNHKLTYNPQPYTVGICKKKTPV